ncbi:MAG: PIN domain-containing protein [Prevotella sp.]|nr:PIN domain-containing protein [Prevotella sp.]
MKLFLDTNIFPEFIERRAEFDSVCQILDAIHASRFTAFISSGCIYTLAFLFERSLKRQDIHRPELTKRLRGYLSEVLEVATIAELSHASVESAVYDESFDDIEDSFQYQCAIENRCDCLITINIDDFKNADQASLEILTPSAFVEKYLNVEPSKQ